MAYPQQSALPFNYHLCVAGSFELSVSFVSLPKVEIQTEVG
jgi:hypothetical protein